MTLTAIADRLWKADLEALSMKEMHVGSNRIFCYENSRCKVLVLRKYAGCADPCKAFALHKSLTDEELSYAIFRAERNINRSKDFLFVLVEYDKTILGVDIDRFVIRTGDYEDMLNNIAHVISQNHILEREIFGSYAADEDDSSRVMYAAHVMTYGKHDNCKHDLHVFSTLASARKFANDEADRCCEKHGMSKTCIRFDGPDIMQVIDQRSMKKLMEIGILELKDDAAPQKAS